jgi:hypothetical protein
MLAAHCGAGRETVILGHRSSQKFMALSLFRPRDPRRSCPHRSVLAATPLRLPEVTIRTSASVLMPCQQPGRRPGRHRILKRLATA